MTNARVDVPCDAKGTLERLRDAVGSKTYSSAELVRCTVTVCCTFVEFGTFNWLRIMHIPAALCLCGLVCFLASVKSKLFDIWPLVPESVESACYATQVPPPPLLSRCA